jgi:ComF family protein
MSHLLNLLFPPRCLGCDTVLGVTADWCDVCNLSVEPFEARAQATPQAVWAAFVHEGAAAAAVHRFKYLGRSDLARPLGKLLAQKAAGRFAGVTAVVPLPLHHQRFRERGFDQSTLLAKSFAQAIGKPLVSHWLTRTRHTERQVGLDVSARQKNMVGAFSSTPATGRLCLVDDVYTTGASASAAATALLAAGAQSVTVATFSRTPLHALEVPVNA